MSRGGQTQLKPEDVLYGDTGPRGAVQTFCDLSTRKPAGIGIYEHYNEYGERYKVEMTEEMEESYITPDGGVLNQPGVLYLKGNLTHREDGPAVDSVNGYQEWRVDGKRHREDGPAIIHDDGSEEWYLDDKLHRDGGPAIGHRNGAQLYYRHGVPHRDDGPAVITADGSKVWKIQGKASRIDGPAVEKASGEVEYYFEGDQFESLEELQASLAG